MFRKTGQGFEGKVCARVVYYEIPAHFLFVKWRELVEDMVCDADENKSGKLGLMWLADSRKCQ